VHEYMCKCDAFIALQRASGGLRAAGVSRSGRIFMAEKIFYHNNTEIWRASRSLLSSLSLMKIPVKMSTQNPCTYKEGFVSSFSLPFLSCLVIVK